MSRSIFLIRHGQSTHNQAYEATGTDPLHFDAPLSDTGHRQVAESRSAAQTLSVDLVVTTPLTRAIQTAIGLFGESAPLMITPMHRERLANCCDVGRTPAALAADFPALRFDHLPECWWYDSADRDPRGFAIEPVELLAERVQAFEAWIDSLPQRRVAVVGHGAFFRQLTGTLLENCVIMRWQKDEPTGSGRLERYAV